MAEASDKLGILHQNLLDAGFEEQSIQACMEHAKKGEWDRINQLLVKHKYTLLNSIHAEQKQIDCLDFLVYRMEKEHKKEEI